MFKTLLLKIMAGVRMLQRGMRLSDKIFKWKLGGNYPLDKNNSVEAGLDAYRDIAHFPDGDFYPTILKSIFSLFGRNDLSGLLYGIRMGCTSQYDTVREDLLLSYPFNRKMKRLIRKIPILISSRSEMFIGSIRR